MSKKLPAEFIKMAKRMGVKLDGFEAEAEEIWRKLDDMSQNRPVEYQAFLEQQYQSAAELEAEKATDSSTEKKEEKTPKVDSASASRFFRPDAGFSIQTTSHGGDGIKVRDMSSKSSGKVFFVNFCCHVAVDLPMDQFGTPLTNFTSSASGLQIPLVVGPVRDIEGGILAVDVIFHNAVIESCLRSEYFKSQVVDLAFEWIREETTVKFDSQWSSAKKVYNGGLGDDQTTPVLFFVDQEGNKSDSAALAAMSALPGQTLLPPPPGGQLPPRSTGSLSGGGSSSGGGSGNSSGSSSSSSRSSSNHPSSALADPSSLLSSVLESRDGGNVNITSLNISQPSATTKAKKGSGRVGEVLISDMTEASSTIKSESSLSAENESTTTAAASTSSAVKEPATTTGKKKTGPAIKRGFLTGSGAGKLYPEGSNEGAGGATGGSFARVMSRCTVVNTADNSVRPATVPPPSPAPTPSPTPTPTPAQPQSSSTKSSQKQREGAAPAVKLPSKADTSHLDQLMSAVDDDWASASSTSLQPSEESLFDNPLLGDLAKALMGTSMSGETAPDLNQLAKTASGVLLSKTSTSTASTSTSTSTSASASASTSASARPPAVTPTTAPSTTVTSTPATTIENNSLPSSCAIQSQIDGDVLLVTISGLSTDFKVATADIQVSTQRVVFKMLVGGSLGASVAVTGLTLNATSTAAKFSKKKGTLTLTVEGQGKTK